MTFRSQANQAVQLGVETVAGTSVPSNKQLLGLSVTPTNSVETTQHTPSGFKVPTQSSLNTIKTEADYEGALDYQTIIYPMASIFGNPTTEEVGDESYEHTFTFVGKGAVPNQKTYTVQVGDNTRAVEFAGAAFRSADISLSRTGENTISGSMIGRALQTNKTLTASPTELDIVPVDGLHFDVYADSSSTSLGSTRLQKLFEGNFAIGDVLSELYVINSAEESYSALVEAEDQSYDLSLTLGADAEAESYFQKIRNGGKTFVRVKATGPLIEAGINYSIEMDMCVIVTGFDSYSSSEGAYVLPVNFALAFDPTWGKALEVRVTNTLASV